jgi:sugar/nucleoside kinase (ribokinase family)
MVDVVVSGRGHDARASVQPGGSAAIAAAWAATEGATSVVVGRVGDDFAGRALVAALEDRGVECLVRIDEVAPTGTFLEIDGEIRADAGANAHASTADLPDHLAADALLVSGYLPRQLVATALARSEAGWTALAPGPLDEVPGGADAIFVDEDEARRLTGVAPAEAARRLGERFRLACVTSGPHGAVASLGGEVASAGGRVAASPQAIGAGDAFAAGVLVALAQGSALQDALEAGCALGARAATSGSWPPS